MSDYTEHQSNSFSQATENQNNLTFLASLPPFHFEWPSTFGSITYRLSVTIRTTEEEHINLSKAITNCGSADRKLNCSAPTILEQLRKIGAKNVEKITISGYKKDVWYGLLGFGSPYNEEESWTNEFSNQEIITVMTAPDSN